MATRQLMRSQANKRIAGVCGGIAEYFDIDPTLVRVAFVVAALVGPGVLLYVILWIVLPKGAEGGVPPYMTGRHPGSAIAIAEERFARGEITAEELAQIRSDLRGD
jgi:phage shock protein C